MYPLIVRLVEFIAMLIVSLFLLRLAAFKLAGTQAGAGLLALLM